MNRNNHCLPLDPSAARIVAYLDGLPPLLRYGDLRQAKVNALRERWLSSPECSLRGVSKPQSASGEELSALMPSVLDKAFKGGL